MKKHISEYISSEVQDIEGIDFLVDTQFGKSGLSFFNCNFEFTRSGSLYLSNCVISKCKFYGIDNYYYYTEGSGRLFFKNVADFDNINISGGFQILEYNELISKSFEDYSVSERNVFRDSTFVNFLIKGSCNELLIDKSKFISLKYKKSTWDKGVLFEVKCNKVIFDMVKINPYYFATKCHDKSSLDLSGAILTDNWSRLRKKYSGLSLFIVFLLTFFYFLPLITHSFFLLTLSKIEASQYAIKKIPLWEALLYGGKTGTEATFYSILTLILFTYNIGRIYMTVKVSKLREEEEFLKDSNFNLASISPEKYAVQLLIDKLLSWLFWISITYTFFKLWDTLKITVPSFT